MTDDARSDRGCVADQSQERASVPNVSEFSGAPRARELAATDPSGTVAFRRIAGQQSQQGCAGSRLRLAVALNSQVIEELKEQAINNWPVLQGYRKSQQLTQAQVGGRVGLPQSFWRSN